MNLRRAFPREGRAGDPPAIGSAFGMRTGSLQRTLHHEAAAQVWDKSGVFRLRGETFRV